jgi:putative restriction endonuclease
MSAPTLEAAHIRPVSAGGVHRIDNGLLLRSDLHRLFDAGYLTIVPGHRIRVSQRLKTEFHNGEQYLRLNGNDLWVPDRPEDQPSRELLEWHADTRFRG